MKAVLFYEIRAGVLMEVLKAVYPRHKVIVDEFHKQDRLLAVGTWADPMEGSMGVFRDRKSAEDFVSSDPFVLEKLVGKVTIKDWNESLMG